MKSLPRLAATLVVCAASGLAGCASERAMEFTEIEAGRVSRVSLAGVDHHVSLTPVDRGGAVTIADRELRRHVRHAERWSLVYCRPGELRPGLDAFAVRFDLKGGVEDERAGDRFAKFYVLTDGRVLVADIAYAE